MSHRQHQKQIERWNRCVLLFQNDWHRFFFATDAQICVQHGFIESQKHNVRI